MTNRTHERVMLEVNVGRTKRMLDSGYTVEDIAGTLKVPRATVQRYVDEIDRAKKCEEEFDRLES